MNNKTSGKFRLDGLFRQHIVLMSGLVTAPIIVAATTFERALVLTLSFLLISYSSIIICRFIPREIVYTVRIICYVGVAAVMYIPTALLMNALFPETASAVSIYIEILVVNSLILAKTESRFYLMPMKEMALVALDDSGFTITKDGMKHRTDYDFESLDGGQGGSSGIPSDGESGCILVTSPYINRGEMQTTFVESSLYYYDTAEKKYSLLIKGNFKAARTEKPSTW